MIIETGLGETCIRFNNIMVNLTVLHVEFKGNIFLSFHKFTYMDMKRQNYHVSFCNLVEFNSNQFFKVNSINFEFNLRI
jgi:hypothetical protein